MLLNWWIQLSATWCQFHIFWSQKAAAVCFYFSNLRSIPKEHWKTSGCLGCLRPSPQPCTLLFKSASGSVSGSRKAGWCCHKTSMCLWGCWLRLRAQAPQWRAAPPPPTCTTSEGWFLVRPAVSCFKASFSSGPESWCAFWRWPTSDLHTSAFYILVGLAGFFSRLSKNAVSLVFWGTIAWWLRSWFLELGFPDLDLRSINY